MWNLQIPSGSEIPDGTYNVTATITDVAGNTSTDNSNGELIIDTSAPVIPTVDIQTTKDTTPIITGTATVKAGETLKVSVNGITYTAGDGKLTLSGTKWSLQIPSGSEIPDGTYNVSATVTNAIGNIAADQTTNELIIKTISAPVAIDDVFAVSGRVITGSLAINDMAFGDRQLVYKTLPIIAPTKGNLVIKEDGIFTFTLNVTGSGTDEFVYEVCDNGSPVQCSQAKVVINYNNPGPVAKILGNSELILGNCNTSGQLLDASVSTGNGLTYSWLPVIYLDNPSSPTPRFHAGTTTRYHLTVTDKEGQKDTTSILVQVADAPKVVTDKNVFVDSPNANILLNGAKSTGRSLTYLWLSKEGIILNGETQATAMVSGLGMYYLQVTDAFGCIAKDSVNVGIYIQAINDTVQTKVNQGVMINVVRNDIPQNAINPSSISIVSAPFHGTATIATDSLVLYQPEELYTGQDEFIYSICDYFGNCDNAKVLVLINDLPFFIPEGFSPNGDGINDQFEIKGLEKYKAVEIEIFNRWGNIVYQSKNYGVGNGKTGYWDGTDTSGMRVGSGPVPSGTYYYILKMNGHENISGAVYLDR
jgi:gliding motility-associated-like protein